MAIINNTWSIEHFQLKQHNAADWSADYILAAGEIGLEFDTKKYKLGDGTKKWSELDYYKNPVLDGLITALTDRVSALESDVTSLKSRADALESDMSTAKTDITDLQERIAKFEGIDTISVNPLLASGE